MVGATPAMQNACGCEIVPRLPRETKVDVTKPDPSAPRSAMGATPAT